MTFHKLHPGQSARITYGEFLGRECVVKGYYQATNEYLVKIERPGNTVEPAAWRRIKSRNLEKVK